MNPNSIIRGLAILLLSMSALHAADKPKRVKYVPPEGFAEFKWGDLRSKFTQLPEQPIGVGAAWMDRKPKAQNFYCITTVNGPGSGGASDGCDLQSMLQQARQMFEGGGTYVLSEYAVEDQGYRFGEADPVMLYPVVFQFCANWYVVSGRRSNLPQKFDDLNQFCGVRLMFDTETREELSKLPPNHVTNYDRVLKKLLAKFGKPKGWVRRGRVVIETGDGLDPDDLPDRQFTVWRWCPAFDREFKPACSATVTLTLNPETGKGTVLYSTPPVWEYAFAREHYGFKGDRLFKILHALK